MRYLRSVDGFYSEYLEFIKRLSRLDASLILLGCFPMQQLWHNIFCYIWLVFTCVQGQRMLNPKAKFRFQRTYSLGYKFIRSQDGA
jgi:hypothetical protein